MSEKSLENILAHISRDRRGFLKALAIGSLATVPLMTTHAMAQAAGQDPGPNGKCDDGLVVNKKGKCAVPKKKELR